METTLALLAAGTLKIITGWVRPFNVSAPTCSVEVFRASAALTRWLSRIWPSSPRSMDFVSRLASNRRRPVGSCADQTACDHTDGQIIEHPDVETTTDDIAYSVERWSLPGTPPTPYLVAPGDGGCDALGSVIVRDANRCR
jgi:hypothetical protein